MPLLQNNPLSEGRLESILNAAFSAVVPYWSADVLDSLDTTPKEKTSKAYLETLAAKGFTIQEAADILNLTYPTLYGAAVRENVKFLSDVDAKKWRGK